MLGRLIRVQRQRDPTDCAYCENPAATSVSLDRSMPESPLRRSSSPSARCQVPVPVLQVGSGSCVTAWRRFQAALMREGRPPALANAPCSRLRSWRIGCTRSTSEGDPVVSPGDVSHGLKSGSHLNS